MHAWFLNEQVKDYAYAQQEWYNDYKLKQIIDGKRMRYRNVFCCPNEEFNKRQVYQVYTIAHPSDRGYPGCCNELVNPGSFEYRIE
jgi:hypothetical protein